MVLILGFKIFHINEWLSNTGLSLFCPFSIPETASGTVLILDETNARDTGTHATGSIGIITRLKLLQNYLKRGGNDDAVNNAAKPELGSSTRVYV